MSKITDAIRKLRAPQQKERVTIHQDTCPHCGQPLKLTVEKQLDLFPVPAFLRRSGE